jgi:hypothetical protein
MAGRLWEAAPGRWSITRKPTSDDRAAGGRDRTRSPSPGAAEDRW